MKRTAIYALPLALLVLAGCKKESATALKVTTAYPKGVTASTAQCGGEVTFDGGAPIARGICWGTAENPTVADSKTVDGSGNGAFQSSLMGLSASTTYYARAYATSTVGTAYGAQVVIRTMQGTLTDIDGNTYQTVLIGGQEWMAENLKVTHYRNGDPILNGDTQWPVETDGTYLSYENNSANAVKYGYLYNYYAMDDSRNLCPTGWHVPTRDEWNTLINYLGGESVAGYKMKMADVGVNADNSSGFGGKLGGSHSDHGGFINKVVVGYWWSSTTYARPYYSSCYIKGINSSAGVYESEGPYFCSISLRCIKD